jgi:hypothetical protein
MVLSGRRGARRRRCAWWPTKQISGGTLRFGDRVVNAVPPRQRDVAMVFQNTRCTRT